MGSVSGKAGQGVSLLKLACLLPLPDQRLVAMAQARPLLFSVITSSKLS